MIRRCFSVFDGIGPGRERAIRAAGIGDWDAFLAAGRVPGLSATLGKSLTAQVRRWSRAIEAKDAAFFARALERREHWLLFEAFADSVCYLDIETTGLSASCHDVTVVGLYGGHGFRALVRGRDLSAQTLREALDGCRLLVTYFGSAFDIPFLRENFPQVHWDLPHFDLCFAGRRVGLTGGLKEVERMLGIKRPPSLVEVDGFEAVRLWRRYERGEAAALDKLIRYNEADTCDLARIARIVYDRLSQKART